MTLDPLERLWRDTKPIVGMVHLAPLPGSPGWGGSMEAVQERALSDVWALEEGGVDGILVENFGDVPFLPDGVPPETTAAMGVVVAAVVRAASVPVGVNVLRNDARSALGVAAAAGARFIRVNVHTGVMHTDQGVLEGRAHETLRVRRALEVPVSILADVMVKHGVPPAGLTLETAAEDTWRRGLADGLVVTGPATGRETDPDQVRRVKEAVPGAPVWVGSGIAPASVGRVLDAADGLIVGSWLCRDGVAGRGVEKNRVRALVEAAREGTAR